LSNDPATPVAGPRLDPKIDTSSPGATDWPAPENAFPIPPAAMRGAALVVWPSVTFMTRSTANPVKRSRAPEGHSISTLSMSVASPSPKWTSRLLWPMKVFWAETSRRWVKRLPPIVAVSRTLAPIAERFDRTPARRKISQWLPLASLRSNL
jgi:hypothetical protein